jgi:hypothetical protein
VWNERITLNFELETTREEEIVKYFVVISQNSVEGLRKIKRILE